MGANLKIQFWSIGKNNDAYIKAGVEEFTKRISKYYKVEWTIITLPKNTSKLNLAELKKKEGEKILGLLKKEDYLVALDQKGNQLSSEGVADLIKSRANESVKSLIFIIGGSYGLDKEVLERANFKWSFSHLTFPHQLVRLLLTEQIYRACTIIKNEKYHH